MNKVAYLVNSILKIFGLRLLSTNRYNQREELISKQSREINSFKLLELGKTCNLPPSFLDYIAKESKASHSQLSQDLLAGWLFSDEKGFFCEVGGGDGVLYSNSYYLEKRGWTGVILEPSKRNLAKILKVRSCEVSSRAAWSVSGLTMEFRETENLELSTFEQFVDGDNNLEDRRKYLSKSPVTTTTLTEVLSNFGAPKFFEYLSVDTEGSEMEVLQGLDFNLYKPILITIEHNFTPSRIHIHEFLTKKGYQRVFMEFSRHDDWYISEQKMALMNEDINSLIPKAP
jgi:FkbM family methyltransferase